jgi:hypothetical protein
MKSIIRNLSVAAAILLAVSTTYANTNPTISLDQGKTLVVNLNDWANSDVEITIEDLYGQVLHTDKFKNGSTPGRKYNLKNLPFGSYNLIIESNTKKAIQSIRVDSNSISMEILNSLLVYKPGVVIKEEAIELNQLTLGSELSVSISGAKGTFFTKSYANQSTVNKKFDITGLPKGDYVFTVENNNEYYTFPFVK